MTQALTGANALSKYAAGTVNLTATNTYNGTTTVSGGLLTLQGSASINGGAVTVSGGGTLALGGTSTLNASSGGTVTTSGTGGGSLATYSLNAIGAAGSTIALNNSSGTLGVIFGGSTSETTDRVISHLLGGAFTNSGTGTLTFSNNFVAPNTAIGMTFTGGGRTVIPGVTGNTSALLNFNKAGVGTLTVNGDIRPNGGNIRAQGGVLNFSSTATTTGNAIIFNQRSVGGIIQFASGSSIKTADANTNGILGGWATFNNTTFAKTNGTGAATDGLADVSYVADTWAAGNNTDVTLAGANPASGSTTNSLRFNALGAKVLTLAGNNTISSGGILVTPAVDANLTTITGGNLQGGANSDLIIHQHNTAGALTIASGIINNSTTSLTKAGAGTVNFSTQKTYTGATNILAGVLDLTGGGGSAGVIRGTANVAAGATLRLSTGDATGFTAGATAPSAINLLGGTLNVNSTSNQTLGSAVINLTGGSITGIAGSNLDFFGGNSALNTLASGTTSTISGAPLSPLRQGSTTFTVAQGYTPNGIDLDIQSVLRVSPSGDAANAVLTKAGAGTMLLSGTNTYTGGTTVAAGTLQAGSAAATNGKVTLNGGNLTISSGVTYNVDGGLTFASNTAASVAAASGSAAIRGNDVNSPDVIVNTGITGSIASSVGVSTAGFGFRVDANGTGAVTIAGAITGTGTASNALGLLGQFAGADAAGFNKLGTGTLTLTGASSFTGATSVQNGTLLLSGGTNRLPAASAIYLGGSGTSPSANSSSKLALEGISQTITGLKNVGTGTGNAVVGANATLSTLTINNTNAYTFGGTIGGVSANENNLALAKSGAGIQTLTGANTYSGGTTISAGTLLINNTAAGTSGTGSGAVTVNGSGTLGGSGSIAGPLSLNTGGTISPGSTAATPGKLTTVTESWAGGGAYTWELSDPSAADPAGAGTAWDLVELGTATLTVNGSAGDRFAVNIIRLPGATGTIDPDKWFSIAHAGAIDTPLAATLADAFVLPDGGGQAWEIRLLPDGGTGQYLQISPVPEPTSAGVIAAATAAFGLLRRHRRGPAAGQR